jgi:hypothetical protein
MPRRGTREHRRRSAGRDPSLAAIIPAPVAGDGAVGARDRARAGAGTIGEAETYTVAAMSQPIRIMIEQGKKRAVASAFDWPGWDRAAKSEDLALAVLGAYRERYDKVAERAGLAAEFRATGQLEVVERVAGLGMTDFYGLSYRSAGPEHEQMTEAECERKIALLRACWAHFDEVGSRVSAELRKGPRGGGRDKETIIRHANGAEIHEFAKKVGVIVPLETRDNPAELRAYRDAFADAIREHNGRGASARTWTVQFLIRHAAYHMLDHAWELEDRDLGAA